jgi:hypothetical protein
MVAKRIEGRIQAMRKRVAEVSGRASEQPYAQRPAPIPSGFKPTTRT